MPWNKDLVKQVPSNLKVSLAVADRVYKNLEKQNIANAYEEVFEPQESLGIIEPVNQKVPDQIWIPHRPVIRTEANVTTKIRPVFNCSLKMGKFPSLNEAAFPGIDLMNNLLSLLLYFRSNFYVLLSDIAKAFLHIHLASEEDKNRFCFFRKINGKFVPYRYRTIIFGFVSSPFILNHVIQYHLSAYASDDVSSLIREKFYVDNLILTCNNDVMLSQYVDSIKRLMLEGGLPLKAWVTQTNFGHEYTRGPEICLFAWSPRANCLDFLSDFRLGESARTCRGSVIDVSANSSRLFCEVAAIDWRHGL